jgi:hypothetical protein
LNVLILLMVRGVVPSALLVTQSATMSRCADGWYAPASCRKGGRSHQAPDCPQERRFPQSLPCRPVQA